MQRATLRVALVLVSALVLAEHYPAQSPQCTDPAAPNIVWTLEGSFPDGQLGAGRGSGGVAIVGDIDGDGYEDVAAGAQRADANGVASGRITVWSGRVGTPLLTVDGAPGDRLGAVAGVGDLDGDCVPDILIGAIQFTNPQVAPWGPGYVKVLSGASGTFLPQHTHSGLAVPDRFGFAVANIGDINNDGYSEYAVGAPKKPEPTPSIGYVQVFNGQDGTLLYPVINGSNPGACDGTLPNMGDGFGWAIDGTGDIDLDGVPDFIVGAPNYASSQGYARVVSGSDGSTIQELFGPCPAPGGFTGVFFGAAVAGIGDVDGDCVPDVCVSAPSTFTFGAAFSGRAYAYSGAFPSPCTPSSPCNPLWTVGIPPSTGDGVGTAVTGLPDLNASGFPDVAIGAPERNMSISGGGYVRIVEGSDGTSLSFLPGDNHGDGFGWGISGAGDVDKDGVPDFAVSAPWDDNLEMDAGSIRVFSTGNLALSGRYHHLRAANGGSQPLKLRAGSSHATDDFILAGSLTGSSLTATGPLPQVNGVTIPLVLDSYTQWSILHPILYPNSSLYCNFNGTLDGSGEATARILIPASPGLAGLTAWHAYIVLDGIMQQIVFASNPVALHLQ